MAAKTGQSNPRKPFFGLGNDLCFAAALIQKGRPLTSAVAAVMVRRPEQRRPISQAAIRTLYRCPGAETDSAVRQRRSTVLALKREPCESEVNRGGGLPTDTIRDASVGITSTIRVQLRARRRPCLMVVLVANLGLGRQVTGNSTYQELWDLAESDAVG